MNLKSVHKSDEPAHCTHDGCREQSDVFFALCEEHAPASAAEWQKAGRRMNSSMLRRLADAISTVTQIHRWAQYDDEDEEEKQEKSDSHFRVFKTDEGYRWLSLSSNGFEDREGEIVSTSALQKVVDEGNRTGERGALRIFHIPGTDIGKCDFQAIEGRFLIESGLFDDSFLAKKAVDYFTSTDEALGTSIGFSYLDEDKDGNVYTKIHRLFERSVCPLEDAANPYTAFQAIGESLMDPRAKAMLARITDEATADEIIATAAKATELLEQTVSYKASSISGELRKSIASIEDEDARKIMLDALSRAFSSKKTTEEPQEQGAGDAPNGEKQEPAADAKPDPEPSDEGDGEGDGTKTEVEIEEKSLAPVLIEMANIMRATTDTLASISESVKAQDKRMDVIEKAIENAQEKATKEDDSPRGANIFRATNDGDNLIPDEIAKKAIGESDQPTNPVIPYLADLGIKVGGNR